MNTVHCVYMGVCTYSCLGIDNEDFAKKGDLKWWPGSFLEVMSLLPGRCSRL